ncbi:hypothetical protein FOQG_17204 [Fusarium oxysporum f. sp. raphani 54005]|uniref:Uncharacterized protein n=2 Tax=Fusarium oxysporum f. sp. raphani TaxID=96318 RepID=X0B8M2_FUSOX|nr:hypothetical protein FOQG_17204 [Fusarium oxysporum f. sp. raphani 54005]KAG7405695.1 hypothetical protein Forpi1262_v018424 [Fusarium oxysporum f. sp. raphani]
MEMQMLLAKMRTDDASRELGEAITSTGDLGDLIHEAGEDTLEEYEGWVVAARLLVEIHAEWFKERESSHLEHWVERFLKKVRDFNTQEIANYLENLDPALGKEGDGTLFSSAAEQVLDYS